MLFENVGAGTHVQFSLSSVVCPNVEDVIEKVTGRLALTGEVVMLSDSGEKKDRFAVVQVKGIAAPLVVPIEELNTPDRATAKHGKTVEKK